MATRSRWDDFFPTSDWPRGGRHMDEAAYHELEVLSSDRKYEYIDGVAYLMSGGSIEHDRIAYNVRSALDHACADGPCAAFGSDVQVLLGAKKNGRPHFVYPDVTVSCDPKDQRRGNTRIEAPRIVVEVLSPSTEARDRGLKFKAYQGQSTIQEIMLVNQFAQHIEVWQRNPEQPKDTKSWQYRHYEPGGTIDLMSIDAHIGIDEFYRGIVFDDGDDEYGLEHG